jgi:hypothetical protein
MLQVVPGPARRFQAPDRAPVGVETLMAAKDHLAEQIEVWLIGGGMHLEPPRGPRAPSPLRVTLSTLELEQVLAALEARRALCSLCGDDVWAHVKDPAPRCNGCWNGGVKPNPH